MIRQKLKSFQVQVPGVFAVKLNFGWFSAKSAQISPCLHILFDGFIEISVTPSIKMPGRLHLPWPPVVIQHK